MPTPGYSSRMNADIGGRVAGSISASSVFDTHKQLAAKVGMTPDAFSRAVNGSRAFSAIELAEIADALAVDIHWLITGVEDPNKLLVAARHDYDFASGARTVSSWEQDEEVLKEIALAYRQAFTETDPPPSALPSSAEEVRTGLGSGFVRRFSDRLEHEYAVDVVRMPNLKTSYYLSIRGRQIIVLAATANWFRENWSIAHEVGHIAEGHLATSCEPNRGNEADANAFAAELLLPAAVMRSVDWSNMDEPALASWIWEAGVSTEALARRFSGLSMQVPPKINTCLGQSTQRLLRRHWRPTSADVDPITLRMDESASRRFPITLQDAHISAIADGRLGKGTLAWMLGINPIDLEVDMPSVDNSVESEDLAELLGL